MLRAYIEYTNSSGKGHKWFDTNSEELCVPGTHVTSKRKEQFKKPKIPTPIRKICLPRNRNKLSVLKRLGYAENDCKNALYASKNDVSSAIYWLFQFATSQQNEANEKICTKLNATLVAERRGTNCISGDKGNHLVIKNKGLNHCQTYMFWVKLNRPNNRVAHSPLKDNGKFGEMNTFEGHTGFVDKGWEDSKTFY